MCGNKNTSVLSKTLRKCSKNDVVAACAAMQKLADFHHKKGIDMLKLECTLQNLAIIFLHNSTNAEYFPFTESNNDLPKKISENTFVGASIVFTMKTVVNGSLVRDSTIW